MTLAQHFASEQHHVRLSASLQMHISEAAKLIDRETFDFDAGKIDVKRYRSADPGDFDPVDDRQVGLPCPRIVYCVKFAPVSMSAGMRTREPAEFGSGR